MPPVVRRSKEDAINMPRRYFFYTHSVTNDKLQLSRTRPVATGGIGGQCTRKLLCPVKFVLNIINIKISLL